MTKEQFISELEKVGFKPTTNKNPLTGWFEYELHKEETLFTVSFFQNILTVKKEIFTPYGHYCYTFSFRVDEDTISIILNSII